MRRPHPALVLSGCGVCGIVCIVLGIILFGIIHTKLKEGVDSVRVIPYKGDPGSLKEKKLEDWNTFFSKFTGENRDGQPQYVNRLTPRSLTTTSLAQIQRANPDLTTNLTFAAAKSYSFNARYMKTEVQFSADGTEVSYLPYKYLEPLPDTTSVLDDKHTTVNPLYATAVYSAGSESNLGRGLVVPAAVRSMIQTTVEKLQPQLTGTAKEAAINQYIVLLWNFFFSGVDKTQGVLSSDSTVKIIAAYRGNRPFSDSLSNYLGTLLTPVIQADQSYRFPTSTLPGLLTLATAYTANVYVQNNTAAWNGYVYQAGILLGLLNSTSPKDDTMYTASPLLAEFAPAPNPTVIATDLLPVNTVMRIIDTMGKLIITSQYSAWISGTSTSPSAPSAPSAPAVPAAPASPAAPTAPAAPGTPATAPTFPALTFVTGLFLPRTVRELVEGNGTTDPLTKQKFGGLMDSLNKLTSLTKANSSVTKDKQRVVLYTGSSTEGEGRENLGGVIKQWYGIDQVLYWSAVNFPEANGTGWSGYDLKPWKDAYTREVGVWEGFQNLNDPPKNLWSWKSNIWANISLKLASDTPQTLHPAEGEGSLDANYYEFDHTPMRAYAPPSRNLPQGLLYLGGILHPTVPHPNRATPTHLTVALADCSGCSDDAKKKIADGTYAANARPPWAFVEPLLGVAVRSSGGFEIITEIDFRVFDWTVPSASLRSTLGTVYVPMAKLEEDVEVPEKVYQSIETAHKAKSLRITILVLFVVLAAAAFIVGGLYFFLERRRLRMLEDGPKGAKVPTEIQVVSGKYTERDEA